MSHCKRISNIIAGGVLAFSAIAAPSFLVVNPTSALSKSVYVNYESGVGGEDLYVDSDCQSNGAGTATYCAEGQVLTLNNYSGNEIYISGIEDNVTLKLQGTNTLTPSASTNHLVFDSHGGIIIEGEGTLKASNVSTLFSIKKETTINSGTIDFATSGGASYFVFSDATVTLNGGTLKYNVPAPISGATEGITTIYGVFNSGDFIVNGGSVVAPNAVIEPGSGHRNNFAITGGSVNIFSLSAKNINISGGEVNSTSALHGMNHLKAEETLAFNGGKTTLKKPVSNYSFATAAANQITFANNMCVTGDAHINTSGSMSYLSMGSSDTVVIQQGTCGNNPFPTNPDQPTNPETPGGNNNGPKVPNTGFETSHAILATIIALPILIATTILGRFFYKRHNQRVSFNK